MRLIDADAFIAHWNANYRNLHPCDAYLVALQNFPTANPVKHGKWIRVTPTDMNGNADWRCSKCHKGDTHAESVTVSYCWNCGARMDGAVNETD